MKSAAREYSAGIAGLLFFLYVGILYFLEPTIRYATIWALNLVRSCSFWSDETFTDISNYMIYINDDKLDTSLIIVATIAAFITLRKIVR